jgi:hypothetical protein
MTRGNKIVGLLGTDEQLGEAAPGLRDLIDIKRFVRRVSMASCSTKAMRFWSDVDICFGDVGTYTLNIRDRPLLSAVGTTRCFFRTVVSALRNSGGESL